MPFSVLGGFELKLRANIVEKRGTLQVVVTLKDDFGKTSQRWRDTKLKKKGNKKRAERIKDQFISEIEQEIAVKQEDYLVLKQERTETTFVDYLYSYLETAKPQLSKTSYFSYKRYIDIRIKEYFGPSGIMLSDLKPVHLQRFYQKILDDGCTGNTALHYHAFIRKALQEAFMTEQIDKNIADRVRRPKKNSFVPNFYTKDDVLKLLQIFKGEKLYPIILLTVFYGFRRSEVLGLKWDAIDFVNKTITIKHVVLENKEDLTTVLKEDRTKNASSYRSVPLIETVEEELVKLARWKEKNKKLFGAEYNYEDDDYLFTMENGNIIRPDFVSKRFAKVIKRNNIKRIRFHDLRHTTASIMIGNGEHMKKVQEWLGHASYTTTANLYAHLDPSFKSASAENLANTFGFKK